MNRDDWLQKNRTNFGSEYEKLFAEIVFPLVPELNYGAISLQYPFRDNDGGQRYCDFVVNENDNVRIAIEIDGYDKRGTGEGMSHVDFVDWQRRQASLTSLGWHVLRFANRDVKDDPKRCAEHISLLLKYARGKSQHAGLSDEEEARLHELTKAQNNTIEHLTTETFTMKFTIASFTAVILVLVMIIVWQSNKGTPTQPTAIIQSPASTPQLSVLLNAQSSTASPKQISAIVQNSTIPPQTSAPINTHVAYRDVLTPQGITCWEGEGPEGNFERFPGLGGDGHFGCECSTDMECVATNPHRHFYSGEHVLDIAKSPKGTTCANPINWGEAKQYIGQTWVVVGPVVKITQRKNVPGNPLWVDIGAKFPNAQRLMLIIWGQQSAEFPMIKPGLLEGKNVCVVGRIDAYKGIPQIELKDARQLLVEK